MSEPKKYNYITIDILRGFAASMVFFYHYGINSVIKDKVHISIFSWVDIIGSTYAVPLFFLISGYCIHLSQIKIKSSGRQFKVIDYLKNRFWRIYPVYFISLLFSCSVLAMNGEKVDTLDFLIHAIVGQGLSIKYFNSINLVLWTITVEVLFYILYPIWYFIRNRVGVTKAFFFSLIISMLSWIIFSQSDNLSNPQIFFVTNIWASWCFGAWISEKYLEHPSLFQKRLWWISGALCMITYIGLLHIIMLPFLSYSLCIALWAWPLTLLLNFEQKYKNNKILHGKLVRPLTMVGVSSYSLYLLHEPLMVLRNIIFANIIENNIKLVFGAAWIFIIFAVSWISYKLFEMPFLAYRIKK